MLDTNKITPDRVFHAKQNCNQLLDFPGFEGLAGENLPQAWPVSTLYLRVVGTKQVTLEMEDFVELAKTLKVIDNYQVDPKAASYRYYTYLSDMYPLPNSTKPKFQGVGAPLTPLAKISAAVRDCWQRKQWAAVINCSNSKVQSISGGGLMKDDAEWLSVLLLQNNQIPYYSSMTVDDMAYEIYQRFCDSMLQDGTTNLWGQVTPSTMPEVAKALEVYAREFYGDDFLDLILNVKVKKDVLDNKHYPSPASGSPIYVAYRSKLRLGLN